MKKVLISILVLGVLAVGYWLVSPLFITREVNEALPAAPAVSSPNETLEQPPRAPEVVARGTFTGLAGHEARGTASLLEVGGRWFVRFDDDFYVTNGPDVFVYLGRDGEYDPAARLGALKGNVGAQNYEVPSTIDPAKYTEAWVWCRAFSVPFGKAELAR